MLEVSSFEHPLDYLSPKFSRKLKEMKVGDISPLWKDIISAQTNDTVSVVFKRLIDNSIWSLPIYDGSSMKYIAFIDFFDILAYVIEIMKLKLEDHESWVFSQQFTRTSCIVLANHSHKNPWIYISSNDSIQAAIEKNLEKGIYRLAVVDEQGRFISVITQSRLIRFFANNSYELGPIGGKTVADLGLGLKGNLKIAKRSERILSVMLTFIKEHVAEMAIVDDDGRLIDNISISDFKRIGFTAQNIKQLHLSVGEFLNELKDESDQLRIPICVTSSATLADVLHRLRTQSVHRIYLVEPETMSPIGVVTLTDILCLFASEDSKSSD